jgi:hypothetical protein
VQAGQPPKPKVVASIEEDPDLTAKQRRALIEMYQALTQVTVANRRRGGRAWNGEDGQKPGTDIGPGLPDEDDD